MAPPRSAKQPGSTTEQSHPRQGREACRQLFVDFLEGDYADDSADVEDDVEDEVEDDDIEPSQSTAVQNMILGGVSNVWRSMLIRNYLRDILTNATAEKAARCEQETSEGEVQPH